jgi:diguanylate cyclase (GGDEF)-like protein/PAS domain S-box-containing protein
LQQELFNRLFVKPSFRSLLVLHILGSLFLIALVIAIEVYGLSQSKQQYQERVQFSAQNAGKVLAGDIARAFEDVDLSLSAAIDDIQMRLPTQGTDPQIFNLALQNLGKRIPWLNALRVADANGNIKFSSSAANIEALNVADRDYFRQLKEQPHAGLLISKPLLGRVDKKWEVVCARRISLPDGSFGGILYGTIELQGLVERISGKQLQIGERDIVALLDNDGNVITLNARHQQEMQSNAGIVAAPRLDALIRSSTESGFYIANNTVDGIERLYYFQRVEVEPLNVVVGLATDDAFAGWHSEVRNAGMIAAIFALLAWLGPYLIYRAQLRRRQVIIDLEDALNLNQKVIGSSAVGIQAFAHDGRCILANMAVANMVGGSQAELLRQNFRDLQSWRICGATDIAEQALATGITHHLQSQVTTTFGKTLWLQWVFTAFINHGEQMLLVMLRDITDIQLVREELEESNRKLAALSATDDLTGIANRRRFDEAFNQEWRRTARVKLPLALAMIDVDFFKLYNDRYGHQRGDDCLRSVARVIAQHASRAGDLIARYGGEEFVFVGAVADNEHALRLAENIRRAVEQLLLSHDASSFGCVTVSIGVAVVVPDDEHTPSMLLRSADEALYTAKAMGRNRVTLHVDAAEDESPVAQVP